MPEADQARPEIILFEHAHFHGAHKHIFQEVKDLHKVDTPPGLFADKTESIVVVRGTWEFFEHQQFLGDHDWILGPGGYPDIVKQQIIPNRISSLRPTKAPSSPSSPSPPPS